jgi:hypothetical protein
MDGNPRTESRIGWCQVAVDLALAVVDLTSPESSDPYHQERYMSETPTIDTATATEAAKDAVLGAYIDACHAEHRPVRVDWRSPDGRWEPATVLEADPDVLLIQPDDGGQIVRDTRRHVRPQQVCGCNQPDATHSRGDDAFCRRPRGRSPLTLSPQQARELHEQLRFRASGHPTRVGAALRAVIGRYAPHDRADGVPVCLVDDAEVVYPPEVVRLIAAGLGVEVPA